MSPLQFSLSVLLPTGWHRKHSPAQDNPNADCEQLHLSADLRVFQAPTPRDDHSSSLPSSERETTSSLPSFHESRGAQPLLLQPSLHSKSSLKLPPAARPAPPHSDHRCAALQKQGPHFETLSGFELVSIS